MTKTHLLEEFAQLSRENVDLCRGIEIAEDEMFTMGDKLQDYANGKKLDTVPTDNAYYNYLEEENDNFITLIQSMKYEIKVSRR